MGQRTWCPFIAAVVLSLAVVRPVAADEVLFLNGDRLTGTIVQASGGKLTIKTETAGDVTVDLAKVRTFSTTGPILLRLGDRTTISSPVSPGADGTIQALFDAEAERTLALGLTMGQWLSLPMIVIGLAMMLWAYARAGKAHPTILDRMK